MSRREAQRRREAFERCRLHVAHARAEAFERAPEHIQRVLRSAEERFGGRRRGQTETGAAGRSAWREP
jgi:hypothetical protein